jgi:hypothetical protein
MKKTAKSGIFYFGGGGNECSDDRVSCGSGQN